MAVTNRAAKITKLVSALKKHYKPVAPGKDRTLLEHLLLSALLENSSSEDAEQAFQKLQEQYFDWNEVRVSTRRELAEVIKGLNDVEGAAQRLKDTLQSVFETFYQFDLEAMKKQNLGQSVKQLDKLRGTTRFMVAYVVQNSLSGHAIPINDGLLTALRTLDVINDTEAAAGTVPGLERAVPKTKGIEVGSMLHQLGVEVGKSPYGQGARKRLLAIDPKCKDRLPKRPAKPAPEPKPAKPAAKKAAPKKPEAKKPEAKKPAAKKPEPKKPEKKTAAAKKPAPAPAKKAPAKKKVAVKKKATKKATPAKPTKKKTVKKVAGKAVKKKKKKATPAKRKPR